MRRWISLSVALAALGAASLPTPGRAEMWCADPLWAHEWGVVVFGGGGAERGAGGGPGLPAFFHAQPGAASALGAPVRDMPVDGGERALPIVHFYAPGNWRPVPLGLEVGFAHGEATRWYPQVDGRRRAVDANGAVARQARAQLLAARQARGGRATLAPLGRDPTRQLSWDHLVLEERPRHAAPASTLPWVQRLRGFDRALWVNGASESERFLFYEGHTTETPALRIERGPTWAPGRRHLVLRNASAHAIHDVILLHREAGAAYVLHAPSIPAGQTAGFLLEDHAASGAELASRTRTALRDAIVDAREPAPPADYGWGGAHGCVMQRDPAIPVERATDHRLYAHEADAVLEVWGPRFFDAPGTTVVYREDVAQLDAVMPLTIHTDMYHFVELRRLGLALMENVQLP